MSRLTKQFGKVMQKIIDSAMGNGLMQDESSADGERRVTPGISELIRQAGAESCVLLKNDGVLPLAKGAKTAVFGRCQFDWFYVGYGSGGDVKAPYYVNLIDGLQNAGVNLDKELLEAYRNWTSSEEHAADHGWWGHWPMNYPEMPVDRTLAKRAAERSNAAVVVIGRAAGEDRENTLTKGSYYLTDEERAMLDAVTFAFDKVAVIMNIGSVMDMSWTLDYGGRIGAIMIVWQGGMESGNSAADVLTGAVSPSGRLADSIAKSYADYPSSANFGGKEFNEYAEGIYVGYRYFDRHPEKVLYPFGFGLSYTDFELKAEGVKRSEGGAHLSVTVTNIGAAAGKETVLLWCSQPEGRLDKPVRVLSAFAKTSELALGESETLVLSCDDMCLASFDEEKHAFVLEKGTYAFSVNGVQAGSFTLDEELAVKQCEAALTKDVDLKERILGRLPQELRGGASSECFSSGSGPEEVQRFIASLSDEELEALSRGHGMMGSSLGAAGNAGAFGGILPSLREKGVPPVICADGPAGIRLRKYCSLVPCGTALACTFNAELTEALYAKVGEEMTRCGVDMLLAPGMNIHRNPLCGRNFEYFSEDPLLSGKMAAAVIRGVQSRGHSACPKHFACNNQEVNRNTNDSRVSERALREIYLRNFEIAVKEGKPLALMTSYNKINGVWSHYNYDLATTVLRRDWGFDGCVITDWWMRKSKSPEFPQLRDNAYRVRAQVDVLMPGDMGHLAKKYRSDGTLLRTLGEPGGITRAELQRGAENVLRLISRIKK